MDSRKSKKNSSIQQMGKSGMELPLVSVIIPVANAEQYVGDAIQSALHQTYQNIEVIVIDDASDDKTAAIVEDVSSVDSRVRLIQLSKRSGVASARNSGIENSYGEFIAPLDADDIWMPNKISYQVSRMIAAGKDVGMVYTWIEKIDASNDSISHESVRFNIEGEIGPYLLGASFIGGGSTPLIRRTILDAVGGYDKSLFENEQQGAEDTDLYIKIAKLAKIAVVPKTLVKYRVTPNSMSSKRHIVHESSYTIRKRHEHLREPGYVDKKLATALYMEGRVRRNLSNEQRQTYINRAKQLDSRVFYRFKWLTHYILSVSYRFTRSINSNKLLKQESLANCVERKKALRTSPSTLVSIVIPAFNMDKFIVDTICSALAQTHTNIEIIVVDDCSNDNTASQVSELQKNEQRISFYRLKENSGVCVARNKGLNRAHGEYVVFLDADDILHPTAIEMLLDVILSNEDTVMAYGGRVLIDSKNEVSSWGSTLLKPLENKPASGLLQANLPACGSGIIVKTAIAREIKGYDESLRATHGEMCADWIFYMAIATKGSIAMYKGCTVGYRIHEQSMSSALGTHIIDGYRSVYLSAERLYPNQPSPRNIVMSSAYIATAMSQLRHRLLLRSLVSICKAFILAPLRTIGIVKERAFILLSRMRNILAVRLLTGLWPKPSRLNPKLSVHKFWRNFTNMQPPIEYK